MKTKTKKMETRTFKFSKTRVNEINNALAHDDDATVWFDIVADGYAKIRVDNVLTGERHAEVLSQKAKEVDGDTGSQGDFELHAGFFDTLAESNLALKVRAYRDPERGRGKWRKVTLHGSLK